MTGSRLRRSLGSRGLGELYVMVLIIMIVIITLAIIYSVLNGFSKYVTEKQQSLESLMSTRVSTSLMSFSTVGNNYVIAIKMSGATPLSNAKAVCTYDMGNTQYMQYCSYVVNNDVVYITVPGALINEGMGNLIISIPTTDGLTPGISLYRGPIEVSVIAPSVAYLSSANTVPVTVLLTNNSTGSVNATVIAYVNGNAITRSTIIPPGGSTAATIPINITSAGTLTIPISILVNNYTETIPPIQISIQQSPSTLSLPVACQSMAFGYVGNATTSNLEVTTYTPPGRSPGIIYQGVTAIQGNIAGTPNPIYTYALEEIQSPQSTLKYYVVAYYYDVSSLGISVNDYPYASVYLYPAQFVVNATTFFFFIVTSNNQAVIVYWTLNTAIPSTTSTNTLGNINSAIQSLFPNVNSITDIEGGITTADTWIDYVLNVNNYAGGNYVYVGFGIYLPSINGRTVQGVAYWDYICIGK